MVFLMSAGSSFGLSLPSRRMTSLVFTMLMRRLTRFADVRFSMRV